MQDAKKDVIALEQELNDTTEQMNHAEGAELEKLIQKADNLRHRFELAGGYTYHSELIGVLKGLGFTEEEFSKPVSALSGGERTRVALGKMLLTSPDLIILFTNTVSHKMVRCAVAEAERCNADVVRSHTSSGSALTEILEKVCG